MTEHVNCNLCGADDCFVIAGQVTSTEELLSVVQCRRCGLMYTSPRLKAEDLALLYGADSYAENTASGAFCLDPRLNERRFDNCLMYLRRMKRRDGILLDVGCGTGAFLTTVANNLNWTVHGLEMSDYAYAEAHRLFGDKIKHCTLGEARFAPRDFDAITMWNVLEHVQDPLGVLVEAKRVLKDDGVIVVAVPNLHLHKLRFSIDRILFHKRPNWHMAEHLYHFTPRTFRQLATKAGLVVKKQTLSTPFMIGGSFENLVKRVGFRTLSTVIALTGIHLGGGIEMYLTKQ